MEIFNPKPVIVALDLEFNQSSGTIIQIGAVIGEIETGKILSEFSQIINPQEAISPYIVKLTGITQQMADAGVTIQDAYVKLEDWLLPYKDTRWLNPLTWGGSDTDSLRKALNADTEDKRWVFGRRWIDVKTIYVAWRMATGHEIQGGLARSLTKLGLRFEGRKHNACDDAKNTFYAYHSLLQHISANKVKQETS